MLVVGGVDEILLVALIEFHSAWRDAFKLNSKDMRTLTIDHDDSLGLSWRELSGLRWQIYARTGRH